MMSVNKAKPHIFVLPEDRSNQQLANGFHLEVDQTCQRQMQVLDVAGGWKNGLNLFKSEHIVEMERYSKRFMVLLIDFDNHSDRLETAKRYIPGHLAERVFILGALSEPEALKAALGPYETIGLKLAKDCRSGTGLIWDHELLQHNASELERLRRHVRPILFL